MIPRSCASFPGGNRSSTSQLYARTACRDMRQSLVAMLSRTRHRQDAVNVSESRNQWDIRLQHVKGQHDTTSTAMKMRVALPWCCSATLCQNSAQIMRQDYKNLQAIRTDVDNWNCVFNKLSFLEELILWCINTIQCYRSGSSSFTK